MPQLRHYDHLNTARFITFSCYRRHKLLLNEQVLQVFLETLQTIRIQNKIKLFAYVIMPEHVHLILHPPDTVKLGPVIGRLKSKVASKVISENLVELPRNCIIMKDGKKRRAFWQPRCYDHNCRTNEIVVEKINYIHNNPVKRGLTSEPGKWYWSSYAWYAGESDVPIAMDVFDEDFCVK